MKTFLAAILMTGSALAQNSDAVRENRFPTTQSMPSHVIPASVSDDQSDTLLLESPTKSKERSKRVNDLLKEVQQELKKQKVQKSGK